MAAASKPTVHLAWLLIFATLTIVCGVGWFLAYKGSGSIGELKTANDSLTKKAAASDAAARKALDDIERIKRKGGWAFAEVGDEGIPNTVLGDMQLHIKNYGGDVAQPTYNDTIAKLSAALAAMTLERNNLKDELKNEVDAFRAKQEAMNAALNEQKTARNAADRGKSDSDSTHLEELRKKEADIGELRKALAQTRTEFDDFKDAKDRENKALSARVAQLLNINRKLSDELEQKTRVTFEREDGHITWVDAANKRVFLDLGSVDGLRPRTTFSVYRKGHTGIGRDSEPNTTGPEDIKGAIEVLKVKGPHEAEARIVQGTEDLYHPIGKGDPIYSPLWSSGRGEAFSTIGILDLDGDGKGDRDMFHDIVGAAGGIIDNEVDDSGNLFVDGKLSDDNMPHITEKTKFLVVGKMLDPADVGTKEERDVRNKVNALKTEMINQARERAVRIVSLSDFLSFMGYKSQRRLYIPGTDAPYQLKNQVEQSRTRSRQNVSPGIISGAYTNSKNLRPKTFEQGETAGGRR
jgi:hypothetical protein